MPEMAQPRGTAACVWDVRFILRPHLTGEDVTEERGRRRGDRGLWTLCATRRVVQAPVGNPVVHRSGKPTGFAARGRRAPLRCCPEPSRRGQRRDSKSRATGLCTSHRRLPPRVVERRDAPAYRLLAHPDHGAVQGPEPLPLGSRQERKEHLLRDRLG